MEEIKKEFEDLITTKTFLKGAINEKGGTITDDTPFSEYPNQVRTKTGNVFDTLNITENGRFDTKDYKSVNVGIAPIGAEVLIDLIEGDITELTIPYGTTKIKAYAFYYSYKLNKVIVPNSVKEIGGYAFAEGKLQTIILPNTISTIPNYCFYRNELKSITIPDSVTSIGNYAFQACYFTNVEIPDSVTSIGNNAFYNCRQLINIKLSNSLPSLSNGIFEMCTALEEITIPESVTSIGGRVFNGCSKLSKINLPKNITMLDSYLFENCTSLKEITIPESVTNIGSGVFSKCTALTNLTIPKGVTNIGSNALQMGSTTNKATIVMESETPCTISSYTFTTSNISKIFVPSGTRNTYISATNWSSLASYIVERNNVMVNVPSALLNNENYTYSIDGGKTYQQFTSTTLPLNDVATIKMKSLTADTTILIGTTAGGNDVGTIANSELTFSFNGDTTIYLTIQ